MAKGKRSVLTDSVTEKLEKVGATWGRNGGSVEISQTKLMKFVKLIREEQRKIETEAPEECGNCGSQDIRRIDDAWQCHDCCSVCTHDNE